MKVFNRFGLSLVAIAVLIVVVLGGEEAYQNGVGLAFWVAFLLLVSDMGCRVWLYTHTEDKASQDKVRFFLSEANGGAILCLPVWLWGVVLGVATLTRSTLLIPYGTALGLADVVYRLREADTEGTSRLQTLMLRGGSRMPLWGIACLLLLLPVWRHHVPQQMDLPDDSALRSSFFALYLLFYVLRSFFDQQAQRVTPESQQVVGDAQMYESQGSILWIRLFSLGIWVVIFLYGFDEKRMAGFALTVPVWFRWVCIGWSSVSLGLLIWVHWSLGPNWSRPLSTPAEQRIVTHGPYQWVRHPMYTLLWGFYLSTALAAANALILLVSLGMAWGLYARVHQEEHMMLEHFGNDYRTYMQRTGRFWPRSRRR